MNTPVENSVTLLTDPPFHAKLREDIVEGDPDSVQRDEVRVFHGLSVSGDVTGKYVYAGYGRKGDFELLQEKGMSDLRDIKTLIPFRYRFHRQDCSCQVWWCLPRPES
jgi:hypothetical protein